MGEHLDSLNVKELKQLENRLERGIARVRSKKVLSTTFSSVSVMSDVFCSLNSKSCYLLKLSTCRRG